MEFEPKNRSANVKRGSITLGLALAMLMFGAMAILFMTKVGSREFHTTSPIYASKAHYHAQSGVEYILRYAFDNPTYLDDNDIRNIQIENTTVSIRYTKNTDTLTSTALISGTPDTRSMIRITNFSSHVAQE